MILNLYCIKDELANNFTPPVTIDNDEVAKRYFQQTVEATKLMKDNPEDFSIWAVGSFSTETGQIAFKKPEKLIGARSFEKLKRARARAFEKEDK